MGVEDAPCPSCNEVFIDSRDLFQHVMATHCPDGDCPEANAGLISEDRQKRPTPTNLIVRKRQV